MIKQKYLKKKYFRINLDWFIKEIQDLECLNENNLYKKLWIIYGLFMTFFKIFYELLISIFYLFISFYKPKINILKSIMHLARFLWDYNWVIRF